MSIQMGRPRKLCRTQRTEFGLRERRNVAPVGAHLGHTPILGESTADCGRVGSSAGRCEGRKRLRGNFLCRLRLNSIAGHGISLGGRRRKQVRWVYMRPSARLQGISTRNPVDPSPPLGAAPRVSSRCSDLYRPPSTYQAPLFLLSKLMSARICKIRRQPCRHLSLFAPVGD